MKALLNKNWVKAVCSFCLAFSAVIASQSVCIVVFGEPEYPTED